MNIKEVAMVIAIAFLTALFLGLLVDAAYSEPEREDYCSREIAPKPFREVPCVEQLGLEDNAAVEACYQEKGQPRYVSNDQGCFTAFDYCDFCDKEYRDAQDLYNRNVFFILAPVGVILLIGGLFVSFEVVGSGLMFSGILTLAYATIRYFSSMSKVIRVIVIFIELMLLVFISIRKLKK